MSAKPRPTEVEFDGGEPVLVSRWLDVVHQMRLAEADIKQHYSDVAVLVTIQDGRICVQGLGIASDDPLVAISVMNMGLQAMMPHLEQLKSPAESIGMRASAAIERSRLTAMEARLLGRPQQRQ